MNKWDGMEIAILLLKSLGPGFYPGIIDRPRISRISKSRIFPGIIPGPACRQAGIPEGEVNMVDLIYGELSYRVIGILYKIYNAMGAGFQEKYYQRAVRKVLEKEGLPFLEQVRMDIDIEGAQIGRYYIDFVIDHKIALEIKAKSFFSQRDIRQILGYLKKSGLEVGLLAAFSSEGLKIKRLLRGYQGNPGKSE
jgi:GxxExxY protein